LLIVVCRDAESLHRIYCDVLDPAMIAGTASRFAEAGRTGREVRDLPPGPEIYV